MSAQLFGLLDLLIPFGFFFAFAFWQLRSVNKDIRERKARESEADKLSAGDRNRSGSQADLTA